MEKFSHFKSKSFFPSPAVYCECYCLLKFSLSKNEKKGSGRGMKTMKTSITSSLHDILMWREDKFRRISSYSIRHFFIRVFECLAVSFIIPFPPPYHLLNDGSAVSLAR